MNRLRQLGLWLLGCLLLAWAVTDPRFRDAEGFLSGESCLPLALGLASIALGAAATGGWQRFASWFSLGLVGQAVALQMIDAGPALHYQHYVPLDRLATERPWLLVLMGLQTAAVGAGLWRRGPELSRWLSRTFKPWQILAIALVWLVSGAAASPDVSFFAAELSFAAFVQLVNLGNALLMAWAVPLEKLDPAKDALRRWVRPLREAEWKGIDGFSLLAACWVTLLAMVLALFSYERHPHIPDEVAYLLQAAYLREGALTVGAPPVPQAFELYLMHLRGEEWFSVTPPGWPLLLAVGVLIGVPWLINPLLAGLNVLLTYVLLRSLYDRRVARLGLLLISFSPWFIFMGMNFMTHMLSLTCALVATLGTIAARRTGRSRGAWLGGFALGLLALIRPLEALIMALLLGMWAIGIGGKRLRVPAIAGLVLGSMLVGATLLPYNSRLTGEPTVFPLTTYTDQHFHPNANALGFGPDRGMGWGLDPLPGHSPLDGMINAQLNLFSLNVELFGWSLGSILLISMVLFAGRLRRSDYLLLAVIAGTFVAHFFYYYNGGPDFGARYWFLMIVPAIALTARGIEFLEAGSHDGRVIAAFVALSLISLVSFFPWRAIDKYHHFRGMRPDIRSLDQTYGFGRSLVFIQGSEHPDYSSAAIYNPVDLGADVPIYVWERSAELRAEVVKAYPGRRIWIVQGPTMTRRGYAVVDGPGSKIESSRSNRAP